ncbi:MAG: hypothetical protein JWM41_148 [Gemmatimonadetes bacterium]|nr:hypothetical protein [Gemmatimonadota bacterium]
MTLGACRSTSPASLAPAPNSDSTRAPKVTAQFYANRPYGSESQFNPFSLIVNGGYDQLRTAENRQVFSLPYRSAFHTVLYTVTHPEPVLRHYGYKDWLTHEVFPLSLKGSGGGQWYPNYQLHLFAGGMTYYRTVEWYEQHGATHPRLAAGFTVYAWHLLTEMVESNGVCCEDEDGLTDLYIFDAASILLWNQGWMRRAFSGRVEFTDWPGQPTISRPKNSIENAYMMAMLRVPLPRTDDWKLMTTMGNAFLFGVSGRVGRDMWLSASGGFDPSDNPVIDSRTGAKTATLLPNAGLFLDRHGSLLVSFITKGGSSNGPTLNVYPGVVGSGAWSPGLWAQGVRGGGLRFGVVSKFGIGLGGARR